MHGCLRYSFDRKLHNAHHPHKLKRNIIWNLNQIIPFQVRTVELFKFSRQCRAFDRFLGSLIFHFGGHSQPVPNSLLEGNVPLLNHMQQDGSTPVFFCSQEFPWICWFDKPFKKSLETKKATKKHVTHRIDPLWLVYLPTFTIKLNHVGKYTILPRIPHGIYEADL